MLLAADTSDSLIGVLDSLVERLIGPWGAVVALLLVIYFLWRLFREAQRDLRVSDARVDGLTDAVRELTAELRSRRR